MLNEKIRVSFLPFLRVAVIIIMSSISHSHSHSLTHSKSHSFHFVFIAFFDFQKEIDFFPPEMEKKIFYFMIDILEEAENFHFFFF